MKNILKRSEVLDTSLNNSSYKKATIKLTAYYSLGVFLILFIFSGAFYFIFSSQIQTNILDYEKKYEIPGKTNDLIGEIRENPFHELEENLLSIVFFVDMSLILVIVVMSYFLSKKTLAPLEESYLKQKIFLANASHELKTPLAVMKAGSESTLISDRSVEEYKVFIEESLEEIDRLSDLTNDLLNLNSYEENNKNKINFSDLVKKYSVSFEKYAAIKNISIITNVEKNYFINGSEKDLIRLLLNLLKNSIDYGRENGKVEIGLYKQDKKVHLSVKDDGIGIPSEKIEYIFEPFYKIDSSYNKNKNIGTGLGLSIVKKIVSIHGGEIKVKSEVGKGSEFIIIFPLA